LAKAASPPQPRTRNQELRNARFSHLAGVSWHFTLRRHFQWKALRPQGLLAGQAPGGYAFGGAQNFFRKLGRCRHGLHRSWYSATETTIKLKHDLGQRSVVVAPR
jgi:hypothetical protein